jgi:hypothetical protein
MDVAALLYILGSFVPEIPSFCAPSAYYIVKNVYKITTPQRADRSNTSFRKTGLTPRVISSWPLNGKGGVFSPLINKQFKAHQHQVWQIDEFWTMAALSPA